MADEGLIKVTDLVTKGWSFVGDAVEGQPIDVAGADPWANSWMTTLDDRILVIHPSDPTKVHSIATYLLECPAGLVRFAAWRRLYRKRSR